MGRTIVIHPGYRIRDLVACAVIVVLGAAFVYAVNIGDPGPALRVPTLCFMAGLALLMIAFSAGALVDRLTQRYPALVKQRRCPRAILLGVPLIAIALATFEPTVRDAIAIAWRIATDALAAWWPAVKEFFASFGAVFS